MKFSVGDAVVLKRTGEEGVIVAYIGADMVEVNVNNTHFPVYLDEVDHPYLKWFTEKPKNKKSASVDPVDAFPVEKQKNRAPKLPSGVYLSFMPVFKMEGNEDIVQELKVYLINELDTQIHFSYEVKTLQRSEFRHEGALHAFGHVYLHKIEYADMNDRPRFHWKLSNHSGKAFKAEEGILTIKPSRLFEHINDILQKNEPTFSYLLVKEFDLTPAIAPPKEKLPPPVALHHNTDQKIRSFADMPRYEVDLHIEQLLPSHKGLSNTEIMNIQLGELSRQLHLAIRHRQEKMIIIHGLGSGALKDAVHKLLKEIPEICRFSNEWIGKYGFGATEVHFTY